MRAEVLLTALVGGAVFVAASARDSRACGGCFVRPTSQNGTVVTDHRMIFAVSPTQTTLYDQIQYSGSPSDFAWVLPIHGQVGLGVSSDLLFSVLDQQTQTTILAPPYPCPACNCAAPPQGLSGSGSSSGGFGGAGNGGVTVIAQQVVGPYATVQLHPNSPTDTAALTAWLDANSYSVPPAVDPIIAAYVQEGFDFLAIKLVPGQGVQAMRPISVTSTGAALSLPLRMVAAGTGSTVGISLWVVATGRYEPQNFAFFTIDPSSLVWDWSTSSSNYATLRAQKEQLAGNAAWQIESSLDLSPYSIEGAVLRDPSASAYSPVPGPDGGVGQTALEVRSQDINTLFPTGGSSVRITRMRADLSQSALANDLVLQASVDQSSLSNVYQVKLSTNANCPVCSCGGGSGTSSGAPPFGGTSPIFGGSSGTGSGSGGTAPGGSGSGAVGGGQTDAGDNGTGATPGQHSGCSTSSSEPPGPAFFASLLGMVGLGLLRARTRKARRTPNARTS
jgi:MYXO-CTERM domain-containing protein